MCALRDYRSIPAVSLACQYRLELKPKRPEPVKINRKKKTPRVSESDEKDDSTVKPKPETKTIHQYHYLQRLSCLEGDEFEDFDFDEDDEFCEVIPQIGDLSQKYYISACKDLDVKPIKVIHDGLVQDDLICKGTKLITNDVKACTIALLSNSNCELMHFEGNDMGPEAGRYLGEMTAKNTYFTDITISWNNIGSLGAEAICNALLKNHNVRRLDLTGNKFNENDGIFFKELLEENSAIRELYLGHNYFREIGGEFIAEGLAQNFFLLKLDLSWNHLRMKGAMAIGKALSNNNQLEVLNISWNGFHIHGIVFLAEAMKKNHCLLELDISCNRLSEMCLLQFMSGLEKNNTLKRLKAMKKNHSLLELDISCNRLSEMCLLQFMSGLEKNNTLKRLKISRNHITHIGALKLLEQIKAHPSIALEYIDMGHQHVHDEFIQVLNEIKASREFDVDYGMVWTGDRDPIGKQDETEDEIALLNENPQYVLMEFMRLQKLRLVDLFHQMDKDNSLGISVKEFETGLEAVSIPLKKKTLEKFVRACDSNKNGEIEFVELLESNKAYKEELRNIVKSNVPFEQTAVGRIQKLMRKIMISSGSVRPPPVNC